jgi:RNA polymerase sigma factor (sigma-70 family)
MPFFSGRPDLLKRFRDGDQGVCEDVYWTYVDRVELIVRRGFQIQSGSQVAGVPAHEVADVVQEVFAKAFRTQARISFDGLREYGPFIATIARNTLADWLRARNKSVNQVASSLPDIPDVPDDAVDSDPAWADEGTVRLVEAYLSALPAELANVHKQRFILGRSQVQAAADLGLSRQQLRTREAELKSGLRRLLKRRELQGPNRQAPV